MLPETWESSRCLGAQNFMGERGQMWERMDMSGCPKIMWVSGYVWKQFVGIRVCPNMGANGRPNLREFMGAHVLAWPHFRECFVGVHDTWRWARQNGCAHYEASMPRSRGHTHFDAPSAHETFHAPALPHAPSFSKIFRKNFWKSTSYDLIFATSEIDIGRCSRLRQ